MRSPGLISLLASIGVCTLSTGLDTSVSVDGGSSALTFYPGTITTDLVSVPPTVVSSEVDKDEKSATSTIENDEGGPASMVPVIEVDGGQSMPEGAKATGATTTLPQEAPIQGEEEPTDGAAVQGDTSIVQNNYNVDGLAQRMATPEALIYIVGTLLIMVLTLGLIVLGVILGRLLQKEDKPIMLAAPAGEIWRHDPVYEYPPGFVPGGGAPYKKQPLHVPTEQAD